ncbi:epoxide hydrolase family protein [Arenibaculum pallidiluteum]|uniref:epoxide hydrolase family protein n=1 Tax=Arenibaculum pallidiluteum TaxID=2812559 RepID=UPI001A968F6D|nr:epoxide hydrolase [Arenibaculum pallidiluteum]
MQATPDSFDSETSLRTVNGTTPTDGAEAIRPVKVAIPQAALDDLRRRLSATRWPDREPVEDWSQGVPLARAQEVVAYWRDRYDWRRCEAALNAHPQFRTQIDGLGIHFLHVRSHHENALPMLLMHGWPGSVLEFMKIIGPLTDPVAHGGRPEDAFDVVVPSLPGFGFSDQPREPGWDLVRTANAFGVLMQRLGYRRWVAQGGDWGAAIATVMAQLRPAGLQAAHVNFPLVFPEKLPERPTPEEQRAIDAWNAFSGEHSGYFRQQSTRPQTLAYALADSPVGQAMWIYEKFHTFTDNRGNPTDAVPLDDILDGITLYWLTNTAGSSARTYWENMRGGPTMRSFGNIDLPMAGSLFPREVLQPPRAWAEAAWTNLLHWGVLDRGGHFAAMEQPGLLVDELRVSFRSLR